MNRTIPLLLLLLVVPALAGCASKKADKAKTKADGSSKSDKTTKGPDPKKTGSAKTMKTGRPVDPLKTPEITVDVDDSDPTKRVLFFNAFGKKDTGLIVEELKQDKDFSDLVTDEENEQRIIVTCKYRGEDLRTSVTQAIEKLDMSHEFKDTDDAKHLEVHRVDD